MSITAKRHRSVWYLIRAESCSQTDPCDIMGNIFSVVKYFVWRTASRNELSSSTEFPSCTYLFVIYRARAWLFMSLCPHLSNLSYIWLTLAAHTTSLLISFHLSMPRYGKLYFLTSPIQLTFCILFSCPLSWLGHIHIKSSLYKISILFNILYIVIISPLSLLSSNLEEFSLLNHSSFGTSLKPGIILVPNCCTLFSFFTCFFICGDHITAAYSNWGLIMVNIFFIIFVSTSCMRIQYFEVCFKFFQISW